MADADRDEALRLIAHFERKFFSGKELKPEALAHFFGGSRRHWGNILYNKGMPTRLDLQCLRAANEIVAVRRVEGDDVLTELSSTRPVDGVRASIAPSTPETVKAECLKSGQWRRKRSEAAASASMEQNHRCSVVMARFMTLIHGESYIGNLY